MKFVDVDISDMEQFRRRTRARSAKTVHRVEGESWLPVFHSERAGWDFTALFSNTARAHDLGMTRDWVLIYFERDGREGQRTVVTGASGVLTGRRVVRWRERECREYYSQDRSG